MPQFKIYQPKTISKFLSLRSGETKLGEKIGFISKIEELTEADARFVLFGIPEDIGVRANHGKPGTRNAWQTFLQSFLNVQHNHYVPSEKVLLLGEIDCSEEMEKASKIGPSDPNYYIKLGELVETIDSVVSELVKKIASAGKIPIIIGGGHNNAFGNIKGLSKASGKAINVLNIDAHTDLRQPEHRHSGNGFTYALKEGFLNKYAVFGLQQNYTPQYIFEEMDASENVRYSLFKDLLSEENNSEYKKHLQFVKNEKFGLEVDCDSIATFPSSAISPSGFTLDEIRAFIGTAAKEQNCAYLHLCEAIATVNFPTGKALSFLVTDFIKNHSYA